ncbi:hypothetical protein V5O48_012317, partial [Marasmius crinis-equi]
MTSKRIRFAPLPDPRRYVITTDDGKEHPLPMSFDMDEYDEKAASTPIPITLACIPESFSLAIIGVAPASPVVPLSPLPPPSPSPKSQFKSLPPQKKGGSRRTLTSFLKSFANHSTSSPTSSPESSPNPGYDSLSSASSSSSSSSVHSLTPTQSNDASHTPASPSSSTTTPRGSMFRAAPSANLHLNFGEGLCRVSSREPPAHRRAKSHTESIGNALSLSRWTSASSTKSEMGPGKGYGFGTPLYRTQSTQSYKKSKRLAEQARASGLLSSLHHEKKGNGTKMLNGRVYGAKRNSKGQPTSNPFANIRDTEPEFVEWGYGGMGSVRHQKDGVGGKVWGRLAGDQPDEDEDDGGGMGWVKKRREERERKEREAREKGETAAQESEEKKDDASMPSPPPPLTHARSSSIQSQPQQMARTDSQQEEHEHNTRAVNVPAPRPHTAHSHSRKSSLSVAAVSPPAETTTEEPVLASPQLPQEPEEEVVKPSSASSSSSSSSSDDEDESDRDGESLEDDDEEEDEEVQEAIRKTTSCAGVEK